MSYRCQICGGQEAMPLVHQEPHLWVRCPDCKFAWVSPPPGDGASEGGTAHLDMQVAKRRALMHRARRRVRKLAQRMPGPRLLDVGSGIGCIVAAAAERGLEATGIESDPLLLEEARRQVAGGRFLSADLETLAADEMRFDGIYCSETIERHADSNRFLRQLARLMTPGGALFLTTPALREFARGSEPSRWRHFGAPERKVCFSPANIRTQLLKNGFGQVRVLFNYGRGIKLFATRSS